MFHDAKDELRPEMSVQGLEGRGSLTTCVGAGVRLPRPSSAAAAEELQPLAYVAADATRDLLKQVRTCQICRKQVGLGSVGECQRCRRWYHWSCATDFEGRRGGDERKPYCYMCLNEKTGRSGGGLIDPSTMILGDGGGGVTILHPEILRRESEIMDLAT